MLSIVFCIKEVFIRQVCIHKIICTNMCQYVPCDAHDVLYVAPRTSPFFRNSHLLIPQRLPSRLAPLLESFKRSSKYGLAMMTSSDEGLLAYLSNITRQLEAWLLGSAVQKLVLVVKGVESGETLERWVFGTC